ncbi:hypothetical protein RIR_e17147_A0A2N1N803_9GLOM [Rhizophagus irregularis DAOM 181602=DAOM 197198]|uniref:Uncharacterized protein n=1 Tax=Rhizophagus irregularis TaxID=588596 RepID=A0A2N1N803_9GLOM|nr:hypothetical protein RhiirC2_480199 [Rhizophagus irregularis]GET53500.1 hypothetical protein RIR_e17147_A0A2N1N803_9GLOM [Rhizophagus irregularis DAOM 181602=DAOM 197198]
MSYNRRFLAILGKKLLILSYVGTILYLKKIIVFYYVKQLYKFPLGETIFGNRPSRSSIYYL